MIDVELEEPATTRSETGDVSQTGSRMLFVRQPGTPSPVPLDERSIASEGTRGIPVPIDQRSLSQSKFLTRLAVRVNDKLILVRLADVLWVQSRGNLLRLHVPEASYDCRMTMKDLQARLDPDHFLRVHRNAIVNLEHVMEFEMPRYGNAFVHLRNGKALPISRAGRLLLRRSLLSRNYAEENAS